MTAAEVRAADAQRERAMRSMPGHGTWRVWSHDGDAPRLLGHVTRLLRGSEQIAMTVTPYGREPLHVRGAGRAIDHLVLVEAQRRLDATSVPWGITIAMMATITVEQA